MAEYSDAAKAAAQKLRKHAKQNLAAGQYTSSMEAALVLNEAAVIEALKLVVSDLDYDVYKDIEYYGGEDEDVPTWDDLADLFITKYNNV